MRFDNHYSIVGEVSEQYSQEQIRHEPMLYSADLEFAIKNGGTIANDILFAISPSLEDVYLDQAGKGLHPVIDTKVVMLMPGWLPCIGGWHCDDVPRGSYYDQPDLSLLGTKAVHFSCFVDSGLNSSQTEFLDGPLDIRHVDRNAVWDSVDRSVKVAIESGMVSPVQANSSEIYRFYRDTLHRGTAAKERCWRYFFRLSFMGSRCQNEIRKQVQIYHASSW